MRIIGTTSENIRVIIDIMYSCIWIITFRSIISAVHV